MKIDIREIARQAGVSTATVSRVMNGKGSVSDNTRQRVLAVVKQNNYKLNSIARGLSRQKTDTIGVVLPELVDEFFMDLVHSIDEAAYAANKFVMISSSHSQRNTIETVMEFMNGGRIDGVILMAPEIMDEELLRLITRSNRPLVMLNAPGHIKDCYSLNIDNHQGAVAAVTHLLGHGYEKIAMIKGPAGNTDADERFAGYQDVLEKSDIPFRDDLIVNGDFTLQAGYYGLLRLISQPVKPDAVFAANDMMALGVYQAALASQIRIPEDLAVVGFDDIFLSRLLTPRLTTVHSPVPEMGSKAVKALLGIISGEVSAEQPYRELLSTGLVIGGSCGCKMPNSSLLL